MSTREGNLEAPTRHALGWKHPAFHVKDACFTEIRRMFDICRGCRRCVSLCQAFPTLSTWSTPPLTARRTPSRKRTTGTWSTSVT